ncbi:MAG: hypothetical protein AAFS10_01410 [Myxococcota bacterium]
MGHGRSASGVTGHALLQFMEAQHTTDSKAVQLHKGEDDGCPCAAKRGECEVTVQEALMDDSYCLDGDVAVTVGGSSVLLKDLGVPDAIATSLGAHANTIGFRRPNQDGSGNQPLYNATDCSCEQDSWDYISPAVGTNTAGGCILDGEAMMDHLVVDALLRWQLRDILVDVVMLGMSWDDEEPEEDDWVDTAAEVGLTVLLGPLGLTYQGLMVGASKSMSKEKVRDLLTTTIEKALIAGWELTQILDTVSTVVEWLTPEGGAIELTRELLVDHMLGQFDFRFEVSPQESLPPCATDPPCTCAPQGLGAGTQGPAPVP